MLIDTPRLNALEDEAIAILRETAAEVARPVLMYSIGKDSSVLLHLARKAFAPAKLPFPLLHIDTGWKFREMISFRDAVSRDDDLELIVHQHAAKLDPFSMPSAEYTHVMKTEALREALDRHAFDAAIGGARRDEERSRRKERVFSVRSTSHTWDPRQQRPELWSTWNTRLTSEQTMRVFPLSNWTEIDVWEYIRREAIDVVPLYFADERQVDPVDDQLIPVDDERYATATGRSGETRLVRFRTLGCYPLTAAVESDAADVDELLRELRASRRSERSGRLIDGDQPASMERKKRVGYF
ncbi:MAG: sulfate adenylyltransferase subunit CysD [Gaiellales bacterium]